MRPFRISPLQGVGPVTFGMARDDARMALCSPYSPFRKGPTAEHETDDFETLGMHLYYAGFQPVVEFIELFQSDESAFLYNGVDVFRSQGNEIVQLLAKESVCVEDVGSYVFPKLQVALWRAWPYDPNYDELDRWDAVGVGCSGYYS